ncbi:MAG: phosphate signaling complex protein PhoU [Clostridium sp.]|uniref:phosphate signaling complex protein PhoU n=1 Tax=Clostridium sp. TaxID=1506 RepID=UPI002A86B369|nr:phosphate signaling complex protein PhoU [Clostridium sp.]MDY5098103.1 phosphate signaling complex protein PhoU [Clostridium sp.]
MTRGSFDIELQNLHNDLLRMSSMVEKQIYSSIEALVNHDDKLADTVIKDDDLVDKLEVEIDTKCIMLIGREQPLAKDLRNVFTATKIVTDLERMADHAVDIAKIVKRVSGEVYAKQLIDLPKMAKLTLNMIRKSIDAYIENSEAMAYETCKLDDEIDELYSSILTELLNLMTKDNSLIHQCSQFLFVCKFLERIADHATNICEATIYLITGEVADLND